MNFEIGDIVQKILNGFLSELEFDFRAALSFDYMIRIALERFPSDFDKLKEMTSYFGFIGAESNLPSRFSNINVYVPTAIDFAKDNPYAAVELFHGAMLQSWHRFLGSLFLVIINDIRQGTRRILPKMRIEIQSEWLDSQELTEEVVNQLCLQFEAEKAPEKIKIIRKALNIDSTELEPFLQTIRREITVRNLIQHNKGVVRDEDQRRAGGQVFTSMLNENKKDEFQIGQRIRRTMFDLRELAIALEQAAMLLVSTQVEVH